MRAWQRTTVTTRKNAIQSKVAQKENLSRFGYCLDLEGKEMVKQRHTDVLYRWWRHQPNNEKKNPNIIPNGLDSILFGKGFNVLSRSDITGYFANIILRKQESKNGGEDASSKVCESTVPSYKFGAISQENGWVQTHLYKQRMSSCKITLKLVLLFEILF